MDCAAAYFRESNLDDAERHVTLALERGIRCPGSATTTSPCIAKARGDYEKMQDLFTRGGRSDPQHWVLIQNVQKVARLVRAGGAPRGSPLELEAHADFQLLERTAQPTLPGPLPDDFAVWSAPAARAENPEMRAPQTGSLATFQPKNRLRVVT